MNFKQQTLAVAVALATMASAHAHSRAVDRALWASDPAALRPWTPLPPGLVLAASSLLQRD